MYSDPIDANTQVTSVETDIMGRAIKTTLPDTTVTYTAYYPTGQVKATWGSQTYPTWNVYDEQNRKVQLHTWKSAPTLDPANIPANPPSGSEVTTWIYGATTGHLDRKQYADGKGTDYTYTAAGRLLTRTWARGITTTYGYTHGLMTRTNYSDDTPDVTITYDSMGRQQSVSTSVAKSEFTYDPATLAQDTEIISYNLDGVASYEFTRVLDRSRDALGRATGYTLQGSVGVPPASMESQTTYGYSPTTGRLETITDGTTAFRYDYLANSNLIQSVTASAGAIHDVTNVWEPNRNVLASKQNKVGTTVVSQYDYSVNAIGQRTNLATSGSAFANAPSWLWGYDSLGQVISADSNVNTNDRTYQYDTIGNRLQSGAGVSPAAITTYTANALNQYSQISNSQILNPSYDDDGNATAYPLPAAPTTNSTLAWDAENRLLETTVGTSGPLVRYSYDSQSRRIAKTVGTTTTVYVYDGWNCIAEYQGSVGVSPALSKSYTWGIDLSGSFQGAGGVGGLLCESQISNSQISNYFPTYDGNGNVSEYLAADGSIAAHFEYDPFGNTVVNTDSGNLFNYRFSTKPLDQTTGFYYYGYRWYDPLTGRWPSRDPIEERGGVNLYGFIYNSALNNWDYLGKKGVPGDIMAALAIVLKYAQRYADNHYRECKYECGSAGGARCTNCCLTTGAAAIGIAAGGASIATFGCLRYVNPYAIAACMALQDGLYALTVDDIRLGMDTCVNKCLK